MLLGLVVWFITLPWRLICTCLGAPGSRQVAGLLCNPDPQLLHVLCSPSPASCLSLCTASTPTVPLLTCNAHIQTAFCLVIAWNTWMLWLDILIDTLHDIWLTNNYSISDCSPPKESACCTFSWVVSSNVSLLLSRVASWFLKVFLLPVLGISASHELLSQSFLGNLLSAGGCKGEGKGWQR